jgi:hypothetical protein
LDKKSPDNVIGAMDGAFGFPVLSIAVAAAAVAVPVADDECGVVRGPVALGDGDLLEKETRASLHEGWERDLHGQYRGHHLVAAVEPADQLEGERAVGDRFVDVGEGVGEVLEAATVVGDGEIALDGAAELGANVDGASRLVVTEERVDHGPHLVRCAQWRHHHIIQLVGDGGVEPEDE